MTTTPTNSLFTKSYRATGHCRLTAAVLARSENEQITLGIERVVTSEIRVRPGTGPWRVQSDEPLLDEAKLIQMLEKALGTQGGELRASFRRPVRLNSAAHLKRAYTLAATLATAQALESQLSLESLTRAEQDTWGLATGIVGGGIAHVKQGQLIKTPPNRYRMILLHPIDDPANILSKGHYGTMLPLVESKDVNSWLKELSKTGTNPDPHRILLDELSENLQGTVAVVGGLLPGHPSALLMDPTKIDISKASQLLNNLNGRIDSNWRGDVAMSAVPTNTTV